jgi:hypothetical protein
LVKYTMKFSIPDPSVAKTVVYNNEPHGHG